MLKSNEIQEDILTLFFDTESSHDSEYGNAFPKFLWELRELEINCQVAYSAI